MCRKNNRPVETDKSERKQREETLFSIKARSVQSNVLWPLTVIFINCATFTDGNMLQTNLYISVLEHEIGLNEDKMTRYTSFCNMHSWTIVCMYTPLPAFQCLLCFCVGCTQSKACSNLQLHVQHVLKTRSPCCMTLPCLYYWKIYIRHEKYSIIVKRKSLIRALFISWLTREVKNKCSVQL